jgi:pimeloyl-ACP methyl ester carboxylesterase
MDKSSDLKETTTQIPKVILYTGKILQAISPKLATYYAVKLFTTPIKHKVPTRELHMDQSSKQTTLFIPIINKDIVVYEYGNSNRKVLLVHGWSGRATQLCKIADELIVNGFSTLSFDAPAHGKSKGKNTIMTEFIESILEIERHFGSFDYAIGHSLGGMSILNAINRNLNLKKGVIIGSGDLIQDIIDDFINKLTLNKNIGIKLKEYFEKRYDEPMENYAASHAAKTIRIPILIIHDEDDVDVTVNAAYNIQKHIENNEIMITQKLGHRKILGNKAVIKRILDFIQNT